MFKDFLAPEHFCMIHLNDITKRGRPEISALSKGG